MPSVPEFGGSYSVDDGHDGQRLTRDEAERAGIVLPDGAIGCTLYGARVTFDGLANRHAVATHHALHWQQEAEQLNRLVHQLRRDLEQAKTAAGRSVIQVLLTTLAHCEPFVRASRNNFAGQRVTAMLDELLQVRRAAEAALEHIR